MKLLTKTNFYFLGVSLIIFCLGGILFYLLFQIIIYQGIDDNLHERKDYHVKLLERTDSVMLFQKYSGNAVSIVPIDHFNNGTEAFSDTLIFDEVEQITIHYRQLTFDKEVKGQAYRIRVRRVLVEQKELIEDIVLLEGVLFLAFVAILGAVNNQVSKSIWQPFYSIVDRIRNYKIDLAESMELPKTTIEEFTELSQAIEKMSVKIHHEFIILKEFSENASHEIQTPLAIVRNKLEILLQSPELSSEQMDLINSATVAINRLSKLNEALIILSKIENRQFHEVENISVNELIDRQLNGLDELIRIKVIAVKRQFRANVQVKMHPYLAEIFFENLIINAIKHNTSPGEITITITAGKLEVANTSAEQPKDLEKLFHRFVKSNPKSQSLGLGLSIVSAIAETYQFTLDYRVEMLVHKISVLFGPTERNR